MKASTMRQVRRLHYYLGVFFAPAIILFSLSGALQTFRLQEEKGYGATPPGWIVWIASVHRDSMLPRPKPPKVAAPAAAEPPHVETHAAPAKKPFKLPAQIFFVLMSIGLMFSAVLGVLIALNNRLTRNGSIAMLVAGIVLPLLLMLF